MHVHVLVYGGCVFMSAVFLWRPEAEIRGFHQSFSVIWTH